MFNSILLTGMASSIAKSIGVIPPLNAEASIPVVDAMVARLFPNGKADRVLIYNPDAIAFWLFQKYPQRFTPVLENISLTLPMQTVFPPVTPVCFGTMYTGALPRVHGIRKYEKPVIRIDTLFDALVRANKKVALVAVEGSSMAKIFLERNMDYYFGRDDHQVEEIALGLIQADQHDLICVYHMDYDEAIHDTQPESERSLAMLDQHNRSFANIAEAVRLFWAAHDTLIVYAPDHGIHLTIEGVGDHFADIPEDMNMIHFYGFYPAVK